MALLKSIDTDTGVPAIYWRITRAVFDVGASTAWYVLSGYASQEARKAGKTPLAERPFTITGVADPDTINRAALYADAETREDFTGAAAG